MEKENNNLKLNNKNIYLDNGATTKVDPEVIKEIIPFFDEFYGNPSSLHSFGVDAEDKLKEARKIIADSIGADSDEIIFTSGGTESNNFALKGVAFNKKKGHIITTKVEHDCILNSCKWLGNQGFDITYLNVDGEGFIDLDELEKEIRDDTMIVSIIHGNNEIGTIQDLKKIGDICKKNNVLFHTDACQSFTKVPINVNEFNIDLITINSHKIHGPKGVGALYIKKGTNIVPVAHGGGQEFRLRSGTENISGIVGFSKAVEIGIKDLEKNVNYMSNLRDYMIDELSKINNIILNGAKGDKRLANNVNITFLFVEGEAMLLHLDILGIAVSTGSACSSKSLHPSHVLTALGRKPEEAHGSLRFTLSKYTTKEEIDYTIEKVKKVVENLRILSPLTPKN